MTTILSNARLVLPDSIVDRGTLVIDEAGASPTSGPRRSIAAPAPTGTTSRDTSSCRGSSTCTCTASRARTRWRRRRPSATWRRLPKYGVTGFCPTTVACTPAALRRLSTACAPRGSSRSPGEAAVLARASREQLHHPGLRGAQPVDVPSPAVARSSSTRRASAFAGQDILDEIAQRARRGRHHHGRARARRRPRPRRRLADAGHIVSLGHSGATYEQGLEGVDAGRATRRTCSIACRRSRIARQDWSAP